MEKTITIADRRGKRYFLEIGSYYLVKDDSCRILFQVEKPLYEEQRFLVKGLNLKRFNPKYLQIIETISPAYIIAWNNEKIINNISKKSFYKKVRCINRLTLRIKSYEYF